MLRIILAAFLGLVDLVLSKAVGLILG